MTLALSVENLGKSYLLTHRAAGVGKYVRLSDVLAAKARAMFGRGNAVSRDSKETFWALDEVSFDVGHGERVGIIGRNGAGKSTLLKIISRITSPTRGRIQIAGRVSSLLEVGTGFHAELTGRENVFLNGAVLGMSRSDIRMRFDEIVQFAEVEKFLDTPVKHYSSGMYMRLAFAVAAHLEPDILIVDEVLAVGDAAFQKKCLGKMKEVGSEGRTVLFVSHNMGAISEFCNRTILLEKGLVRADGLPGEIIPLYSGAGGGDNQTGVFHYPEAGDGPCHIERITLLGADGNAAVNFEMFEPLSIQIDYVVAEYLPELQLTVTVGKDSMELFHAFDNDDDADLLPTLPGRYRTTYRLPARVLKEGFYNLRVTAGLPTELLVDIHSGLSFEMSNHLVSTLKKSFRADRTGFVASLGVWTREDHPDTSSGGAS